MVKPEVYRLSVATAFDGLTAEQQAYAHYMSKAAWAGARVILRQVSPEANGIFDLIIGLYQLCDGDWERLAATSGVEFDHVQGFLDYAATFLSNVGNYFGSGDQKFTPDAPQESLLKLVAGYPDVKVLLDSVIDPMFHPVPSGLGHPSALTQTTYYLGKDWDKSTEDISSVSELMGEQGILPENTRIMRTDSCYNILQASVAQGEAGCFATDSMPGKTIRLVKGDHTQELELICQYLDEAMKYTATPAQTQMLQCIQKSFLTGDLEAYRDSLRIWVNEKAPPVETVIGFVEPYRDPFGVRGEFEGIVGIPDERETTILNNLARMANQFVNQLPWVDRESGDKGPFEKDLFEPPDFSSLQSLAYCSSIIFPGINLPNYNDIRQEVGYKNIIFSNRMAVESHRCRGLHMIDDSEKELFQRHRFHSYYIWVVLHEIMGHGTGRFLIESAPDCFNFDPEKPPINPLNGRPIDSWYRPGQTWTGVFGDLSTSVDECRAELVGAYLIDNLEILQLFGYTEDSEIKPDDLVYNMYLQLGVDGLRGLENYDPETQKWGQAHSRAHYAILQHLLRDTDGLYTITCEPATQSLTVRVDRSRTLQEGKPSLGRMLLQLHIHRCTADSESCRELYEDLSSVDSEALEWREIVVSKKDPPLAFCQANTFVQGHSIHLKEYEPTVQGIIQSWAERCVE